MLLSNMKHSILTDHCWFNGTYHDLHCNIDMVRIGYSGVFRAARFNLHNFVL